MSEWDRAHQRMFEGLTPPEEVGDEDKQKALAELIQTGQKAKKLLGRSSLTEEDRGRLEAEVKAGFEARNDLVVSNLRLAAWFVRQTMDFNKEQRLKQGETGKSGSIVQDLSTLSGGELDYSDRIQLATRGLFVAADKYGEKGTGRFSSYAMYAMEGGLLRAMAPNQSPLRIPGYLSEKVSKVDSYIKDFEGTNGRQPTYEEVARGLELPIDIASQRYDLSMARQQISYEVVADHLEQKSAEAVAMGTDPEAEALTLADELPDTGLGASYDEEVAASSLLGALDKILDTLSDRERGIIEMRYGLDTGERMTLDEVGRRYGITRERVRQIEIQTMSKIRHDNWYPDSPLRVFIDTPRTKDPTMGVPPQVGLNEDDDLALGIRSHKDSIDKRARLRSKTREETYPKPGSAWSLEDFQRQQQERLQRQRDADDTPEA
jgi:RNA polymerase primary sigma factor